KDLPCALATLVPLYNNISLLECETKNSQIKQHADSNLPKDYLPLYNNFFPELVQIQTHLKDFSLCEKHYNQLIAHTQYTHDETIYEISVQASAQTNEVGIQVNKETHELDSKINEIKDLKKQLEYIYNYVVESWDHIQEINKTIIDIDNYITSSGSYMKFINWLESLAVENKSLSKGLLFLAFDNEQYSQFNYLNRGHNTVIYHIVTSFIALNMNKNDYAQFTIVPWICDLISNDQYKKLYYILPKMQAEHDLELKIYLSSILEELVIKKNKKINTIDTVIKNQKGIRDMLAALQAESANENIQVNNPTYSKPLIIKSYAYAQEQKS
ncbi:23173_t:CDS:2, partial [Cetraspora pellucida]